MDPLHQITSSEAYATDFSMGGREHSSSSDLTYEPSAPCPDGVILPDDLESKVEAVEECLQALMLLIGCALR